MRGIEDVLHAGGWTLLLGNSDDHPEREMSCLATLRAEGAAGVVLVPGLEASAYQAILGRGLPLVAIDRAPEGLDVDRVTVANVEGARRAVAHLIALGHRRVGLDRRAGGAEHGARSAGEGYAEPPWRGPACAGPPAGSRPGTFGPRAAAPRWSGCSREASRPPRCSWPTT